jgi:adenylate cyclase
MAQGYLGGNGGASVRVRLAGTEAWLNVKSANAGMSRLEFEYPIPVADARTMLQQLCDRPPIEKTRYWVRVGDDDWEIDVFEGANLGLFTAEIELAYEQQEFGRPDWLGLEVTDDARYYNMNLATNPYKLWSR